MSDGTREPVSGWVVITALIGVLIGLALVFWIYVANFYAFVDNNEVGYKFSARTGKIAVVEHSGWVQKEPFFDFVGTVDTRPIQVCINANSRVLNCKLVQFNPRGLELFLKWHGRKWNDSADLEDILKSYAYDGSGRNYPFLTIIRELKNEDVDVSSLNRDAPVVPSTAPPAPATTP